MDVFQADQAQRLVALARQECTLPASLWTPERQGQKLRLSGIQLGHNQQNQAVIGFRQALQDFTSKSIQAAQSRLAMGSGYIRQTEFLVAVSAACIAPLDTH